jgi:type II secretory pathway component PulF
LLAAAELGGFLDRALADLADDAERQIRVRQEIARATQFIKFVLATALLLGLPISSFIGPMLRTGLATGDRALGVQAGLRAALRTLLWVSLPISAAILGAWALMGRLSASTAWARTRDAWALRLPVLGGVHRAHARASFLTALGRLTHAGVGPAQSWETAAGAVENGAVRAQIERSLPLVEAGGRFSEALVAAGVCTPLEAGLVANGEFSGQVEESLDRVAESYHWQLEGALRRLPTAAHMLGYAVAAPFVLYVIARFYQSYFASMFQGVDDAFGS